MKAQVYDDNNLCRVFDRDDNSICDIWPRGDDSLDDVDKALKRIHIRRESDWKRFGADGFYEATVRFDFPRKRKTRN